MHDYGNTYVTVTLEGLEDWEELDTSDVFVDPAITDVQVARMLDNLEFLTAHRDRHNQGIYFELDTRVQPPPDWTGVGDTPQPWQRPEPGSVDNCRTAGCLAGWAVLRAPEIPLVRTRAGGVWPGVQLPDGTWRTRDVDQAAAEYLGLDYLNRDAVFSGSNTLGDLWRLCAVITNGRITVPAEFRDGVRQRYTQAARLVGEQI